MSSPPALVLHGLLYLDPQESSSVNASFSDFSDRVRTYALNALGLSASLARQDVGFVLLTNNRAAIEQALGLSMPDLRDSTALTPVSVRPTDCTRPTSTPR